MLNGLNEVDWNSLTHAYGNASDIPELLTHLAEETDPDLWRSAYRKLATDLSHQGAVYPAAVAAIPFINQILSSTSVDKTQQLLCLLAFLLHDSLEPSYSYASDGSLLFESQNQIYETISSQLDFYLAFLSHPADSVRVMAIALCSMVSSEARKVVEHLIARLESESTSLLKGQMIVTIGHLIRARYPSEEYLQTRELILAISKIERQPMIVRLASALALGHIHYPQSPIPSHSLDLLVQLYTNPIFDGIDVEQYGECATDFGLFPFAKEDILDVLISLSKQHFLDGLFQLFAAKELGIEDAHLVGRELVDAAFERIDTGYRADYTERWSRVQTPEHQRTHSMIYGYRKGSWRGEKSIYIPGEKLSKRQTKVLAAIVDNSTFWKLPTNLFSYFYGLPDSRDELRKLIEG